MDKPDMNIFQVSRQKFKKSNIENTQEFKDMCDNCDN